MIHMARGLGMQIEIVVGNGYRISKARMVGPT